MLDEPAGVELYAAQFLFFACFLLISICNDFCSDFHISIHDRLFLCNSNVISFGNTPRDSELRKLD